MFQELCYRESTTKRSFDVFLPGSEVPNWFRHHSVGALINLELPSYLFEQIRGITLCAIFRHHQHRGYDNYNLTYRIKANRKDFTGIYIARVSGEFNTVELDHCWFIYLFPSLIEFYLGPKFREIADGSSCQVVIEFILQGERMIETRKCGSHKVMYGDIEESNRLETKKCGAHVVYEEEIEDLIRSMGPGPALSLGHCLGSLY